jgi:hypothetical protein
MPPQPPSRLSTPPPARQLPPVPHPGPSQAPTAASVAEQPGSSELTFSKIVAGAGAAATTAVAGSFLGPTETVMGAALGSVVSAIASTLYERSLDRTRDTVKARVKLPGGRTVDVADTVEIPALRGDVGRPRTSAPPAHRTTTVLPSASPLPPPRRRRWVALTVLTAGLFLVGLLAVTGVELLKGSTLRGENGTSVGRVVAPRPVSPDPAEPTEATEPAETPETSEPSGTSTDESSEEATESESATDDSDGDAERRSGATDSSDEGPADDESDGDADTPVLPLPTTGDRTSEP